jgi:hypothetical protein
MHDIRVGAKGGDYDYSVMVIGMSARNRLHRRQ